MSLYVPEEFTAEEADVLRRYFTNLDGPVFALVNLPEVVKGALFARYSRSPKSLRRLFLDEFVGDLDISGDHTVDATVGLERAEQLYERVFFEYGDDSVAQLGGVHLACEQASNLLTKVLEWGRLMSYLEQSTRYIAYDARLGGRYRYFRDGAILASRYGTRYVGDMDRIFDDYSQGIELVTEHVRATIPRNPADSDFVYRLATRAKALDAVRGILPAASLSNVGIYGVGSGVRGSAAADARPSAARGARLRRADAPRAAQGDPEFPPPRRPARPWRSLEPVLRRHPHDHGRRGGPTRPLESSLATTDEVTLVDFDPDAEDKLLAAICYPHINLSEHQLLDRVRSMGSDDKVAILRDYVGDRSNRRHRPGRAFERTRYRFDVLSDYGAFRDLQRHRMLTIEWQRLTPYHGVSRPALIDEAGARRRVRRRAGSVGRCSTTTLVGEFPEQAAYAVCDGVPLALRDAVQRPRGDPHARAALAAAGPPGLSPDRAGDAPPDRRRRPGIEPSQQRCRT